MEVFWNRTQYGTINIDEDELPENWDYMDWNDQHDWIATYCENRVDCPVFDDYSSNDFEVQW